MIGGGDRRVDAPAARFKMASTARYRRIAHPMLMPPTAATRTKRTTPVTAPDIPIAVASQATSSAAIGPTNSSQRSPTRKSYQKPANLPRSATYASPGAAGPAVAPTKRDVSRSRTR